MDLNPLNLNLTKVCHIDRLELTMKRHCNRHNRIQRKLNVSVLHPHSTTRNKGYV
jgi:hypothetical protein